LSTLTGTEVLLLVASETGHVYTFATRKLRPLIQNPEGKNLIQQCLNAPDAESGDVRVHVPMPTEQLVSMTTTATTPSASAVVHDNQQQQQQRQQQQLQQLQQQQFQLRQLSGLPLPPQMQQASQAQQIYQAPPQTMAPSFLAASGNSFEAVHHAASLAAAGQQQQPQQLAVTQRQQQPPPPPQQGGPGMMPLSLAAKVSKTTTAGAGEVQSLPDFLTDFGPAVILSESMPPETAEQKVERRHRIDAALIEAEQKFGFKRCPGVGLLIEKLAAYNGLDLSRETTGGRCRVHTDVDVGTQFALEVRGADAEIVVALFFSHCQSPQPTLHEMYTFLRGEREWVLQDWNGKFLAIHQEYFDLPHMVQRQVLIPANLPSAHQSEQTVHVSARLCSSQWQWLPAQSRVPSSAFVGWSSNK
jgi:type II secretory pathway pseudopilin PulG